MSYHRECTPVQVVVCSRKRTVEQLILYEPFCCWSITNRRKEVPDSKKKSATLMDEHCG